MGAEVLVEQEILDDLPKRAVVGDPLVEGEVGVDDLLDHVLDLLVEGEAHVLTRVYPRCRIERGVVVELLHHLAERYAVLWAKVESKALVQLSDDAGKGLEFLGPCLVAAL